MTRWLALLVAATIAGCSGNGTHTLGQRFSEEAPMTVADAQHTQDGARVVLRGTITEKCPVAGCWFIVEDAGTRIKVDTKNGAFAVVDVPIRSVVTVAGHVTTDHNVRLIDATGLRY